MRSSLWAVPLLLLAACSETQFVGGGGAQVSPPSNLTYTVEPSGTPGSPDGVLLTWDFDNDPNLASWNVYSRGSTSESYRLRGTTTSNSFHDAGIPHLQYYVTAEDLDGNESSSSNVVTVDERLALQKPATLTSTTLNGAIALTWSDNAYTTDPAHFRIYRVYSSSYDLDLNLCGTAWSLEGTTVAPEFVSGALTNGVPRCFAVSAVSLEGFESLWSPLRSDTPRPDARNVVVYARQSQDAGSGFRFWRDLNADGQADPAEIGLVQSGSSPLNDFTVERDVAGDLYLTPVRVRHRSRGLRDVAGGGSHQHRLRAEHHLRHRGHPGAPGLGIRLRDRWWRWLRPVRCRTRHPRRPELPDSRLGVPDRSRQSGAAPRAVISGSGDDRGRGVYSGSQRGGPLDPCRGSG